MSFYRMHRGWMENRIFEREAYNRRNAWQWLIENAAFTPSSTLERGQLRVSLRFMANAWGWPEPRVRRFLSAAQHAEMIRCVADAGKTLITICNYEKYQAIFRVGEHSPDAEPTRDRRDTDANLKKEEGSKKEEDSVASATAPPSDSPPDPVKVLWDRARTALTAAGVERARVGPLVGKWRKDFGDSAVMAAFDRAERELPSDLVPFLIGCMNYSRLNGNGQSTLTPANKRFLAGREATYRAVLAAEERDRAAAASE